MRLGENLLQTYEIDTNLNQNPTPVSKLYAKADMKAQMERFKEKQLHGYISTKLERDVNLDKNQSLSWRRDRYIESKTEAYMSSIIKQEIPTKYMQKKRSKNTLMSDKCRLCKSNIEDIHHIASSCPQLSSRYYLPLRHSVIAKCVYNKLPINDGQNRKLLQEPDQIYNTNDKEYWWDTPITTATKIKHNKPDLVIWNKTEKICTIIEFSCPADINISKKIAEKTDNYGPLIRNLQIM